MDTIYIRKGFGDYINTANDRVMSGKFWEARWDDIIIRRPRHSRWTKKRFLSLVQDNMGYGREIVFTD